jgi:hypothetical protein
MKPRFFLLAATLGLGACVAGKDESATYQLQGFDSIEISTGVEAILKQGPFAVHAQSRGNDLSRLEIEVRGTTLHLARRFLFTLGPAPAYTITVTAPSYTAIKASTGSKIDGENLQLIDMDVEASTGASVNLSGICTGIEVETSSGAVIDADTLKCASAVAKASSGGNAGLWASEKADGEASTGGVISFFGSPPAVEKETSTGGVVNVQ